jgi:hypothetical protein
MNKQPIPRPSTRIAILPSAGYDYRKATKHVYFETRPTMASQRSSKDEAPSSPTPAWEHIFVCSETNKERRYGIECRTDVAIPTAPEVV